MRSLGLALIKFDWCLYKKKRLRHRHRQWEDHVKTQRENGHLQANERRFGRN